MAKKSSLLSFTTFLIIILIFQTGWAQGGPGQSQERQEQMEARRIAFITRELSLTPAEAKEFWPVYNEYHNKRNEMMRKHRAQRQQVNNLDRLSEQELLEIADAEITNMEEMAALRREYHEKFKTILPVKKVIELYEAERNFNRNLLRESRGVQRGGGRGRN
ncbi:MAG: hypothetical protein K0B37_14570 [Bacteroidales bacterium]|nr:hypothetical protein [Bacteroidales bacterium]